MSFHIQGGPGFLLFVTVPVVPGVVAGVLLHSTFWAIATPVAMLTSLFALAAFGPKRKVTPEQFADELERHLLGTDGAWGWDDTTSVAIADNRLNGLRGKLSKFDYLRLPARRDELAEIIAALRRGDIPDVKDE